MFQLRAEHGAGTGGVRWHLAAEPTGEVLCRVWLPATAWAHPATDVPVLRPDRDELCFSCLSAHREQAAAPAGRELQEAA